MKDQMIDDIVEDAIDKHWIPFECRFIEWEAEYKASYLYESRLKTIEWNGYKVKYVPCPLFEEPPTAEPITVRALTKEEAQKFLDILDHRDWMSKTRSKFKELFKKPVI